MQDELQLAAANDVTILDVIRRLWEGRWIIAGVTAVSLAVCVGVALLSTPVYRATVVLVPAASEGRNSLTSALGSLGGLASLAGIDVGSLQGKETEEGLAVLKSRAFTEQFISDNSLLPVLYARRWDAANKKWRDADDAPTLAKASKYFGKLRSVNEDKKTGLVVLTVDWHDPKVAADWANMLVARLNGVMRKRTIERTAAYMAFLEKELADTSTLETRNAISRLMESQINQRMLANVTTEYAFRVVDQALPADPADPLRPRRILLCILGVVLGVVLGVLVVLTIRVRPVAARSS
jgi:LPS O-antigen subunit length determinant protein (WzzB/FepE family)